MRLLPCFLLFFLLAACGPDHETLAGRYDAHHGDELAVSLELNKDGSGSWTVDGGMAMPFSWSQESGKVVLRTKNGGMVAGQRQGDAIILQLPGIQRLTFLPSRN